MSVPGTQTKFNDNSFYFTPATGGQSAGTVTSIIAGTGVTIAPPAGTGAVTINAVNASDQPTNSIQLSNGTGGFVSVNTATISPATGSLSLGNGQLITNGNIRSTFDPTANPPSLINGPGLRGCCQFQFQINGGDGAITTITPLNALFANHGGLFAVSMLPSGGTNINTATVMVAANGSGLTALSTGIASPQFYFQNNAAGSIYVATTQGSGAQTNTASFTVTQLA
jgi:hypothetical protein